MFNFLYNLIWGNSKTQPTFDPFKLEDIVEEIINKTFVVFDNENGEFSNRYFLSFSFKNNYFVVKETINGLSAEYNCTFKTEGDKLFLMYNNYYPWIIESTKYVDVYNLTMKRQNGFVLNLFMKLCYIPN